VLPLHGWALDDDGIVAVDILVDGKPAGRAFYGRSRPGITAKHPGFPNSAAPGWGIHLDTTRFLNGLHKVEARALSATGETRLLGKARAFQFTNLTEGLKPFGKIEFPAPGAEMFGNCPATDPARRFSVVSGYALDSGIQEDDTGIAYVELMIDRALFFNSRRDCVDSNEMGGLSNCFGLRRLDVEKIHPKLPDSPSAGFRFVLDIGALLEFDIYEPGHHILTIRAGDHFGQVANIAEIPVTFRCDDEIDNEGSIGDIDFPSPPGLIYAGPMTLRGWAVDWEGVKTVSVYVDGFLVGTATYGLLRPDITGLVPGYPDSAFPGWQFTLDSTTLVNGEHSFQVIVTDDHDVTTLLGERTFVVGNP
jgi:N-acetylmuramoyl-L-alanine amidase